MISYWQDTQEICEDDGLVLIFGRYNHKNRSASGTKSLGVYWDNFPFVNNKLSPCVIPKDTRNAILSGLLHKAVAENNKPKIDKILEAIKFFRE